MTKSAHLPARFAMRSIVRSCSALAILLLMDGALHLAGFRRFQGIVRWWPTVGAAAPGTTKARAAETYQAVDRARTWYFKRSWCLQSAATVVCLARLRGVPAELVLGVRKFPFQAHAWAEVDGTCISGEDAPNVANYCVMERC